MLVVGVGVAGGRYHRVEVFGQAGQAPERLLALGLQSAPSVIPAVVLTLTSARHDAATAARRAPRVRSTSASEVDQLLTEIRSTA